jgi:flagellar motor switch protein FliN/FliY
MKNEDTSAVLAAHLAQALAAALSGMTGKEFSVAVEPGGADFRSVHSALEESVIWQQTLSCASDPALWLVAGKDAWASAGQLILGDAGVDTASDEDCRSTWLEILGQTMGGLATALTADLGHEVTASKGEEIPAELDDLPWILFVARSGADQGEATLWRLKAAWSKGLLAAFDRPAAEPKSSLGKDNSLSKTFDLLLDVALPVNVSFGKTYLQIREVLKLNTGSIVELNRFVAEPVEVIVNDCVIARGEVVVVDGNYGVRITQLSSREDRLRSGIAETTPKTGVAVR